MFLRVGAAKSYCERGFPSQVKGVGLRLLCRRTSWVRIPLPAPIIAEAFRKKKNRCKSSESTQYYPGSFEGINVAARLSLNNGVLTEG